MEVWWSVRVRSVAVGMLFLADLARQRSLASAALLFLLLVDEIEGLVFVAVGVVAGRTDLFLASQDVVFPMSVAVAGAVSLIRNWRRAEPQPELPAPEPLELAALAARIGASATPAELFAFASHSTDKGLDRDRR